MWVLPKVGLKKRVWVEVVNFHSDARKHREGKKQKGGNLIKDILINRLLLWGSILLRTL